MNHILVDYENVKSVDPAVFEIEDATFTLLLGPQNRTLSVSLVQALMVRAASVELVRLDKVGRNAVDFALAYYLGRKVLTDPTACFHVVSKDTDYQPLIEHLQSRNVRVTRHETFDALTAALAPGAKPATTLAAKPPKTSTRPTQAVAKSGDVLVEPDARILQHLRRIGKSRPARKSTLLRLITKQLLKGTTDNDAELLIAGLAKRGYLAINEKGALIYRLNEGG